jgi:hypothetical protein
MTAGVEDFSAKDLRRIVLGLPEFLPITEEYERSDRAERARKPVSYRSQREHIERWLYEYDGPGFYGRSRPGGSARQFYNRFKCVAGLIWLAEALGVPATVVNEGIRAVAAGSRNPASECGAFRRVVPWSMLAPLIAGRRGGRHRLLRLLDR